jgi:hypothetical protein
LLVFNEYNFTSPCHPKLLLNISTWDCASGD